VTATLTLGQDAEDLADLTAHEGELLALIAQRLSDRGIGKTLWLTPKTVQTHIRHILSKLSLPHDGQNNRRVLAALVDDQEHPLRVAVRLDAHELLDQLIKQLDSVLRSAAIEQLGAPDVPGGEVAQCSLAPVFVLDELAVTVGLGRFVGVLASSGLDRGLLVAAHDEVAGMQWFAFPATLVEVEDRPGLLPELRIAREDPGAVVPGADRVLGEPSPDGHAGDLLDDPAGARLARELLRGSARERHALLGWQLARQRDHLSADL
jgi:DNA-binding CsgD family transcriptional regulator